MLFSPESTNGWNLRFSPRWDGPNSWCLEALSEDPPPFQMCQIKHNQTIFPTYGVNNWKQRCGNRDLFKKIETSISSFGFTGRNNKNHQLQRRRINFGICWLMLCHWIHQWIAWHQAAEEKGIWSLESQNWIAESWCTIQRKTPEHYKELSFISFKELYVF